MGTQHLRDAIHLAEIAADLMRKGGDVTPAAWRLADAGLCLRRHLDETLPADPERRLCGYDEATGRGAILPDTRRGMWLCAWTTNHGDNDLRDFWTVHDSESEAVGNLARVLGLDNLHCAAVAPITTGTEPQWVAGA
jgi:hypothetical protein